MLDRIPGAMVQRGRGQESLTTIRSPVLTGAGSCGERPLGGARVNNALDRAYAERADFAFGDYRYFPGRPRSVFAEVTWRSE